MRTLAALVVLGVVGAAPVALAEAWRAKPALELGAPPACKEADVSNLFFDLADTGNELSVKPSSGEAFSAPIGPDGSVKATFALPVGAKSLSVDFTDGQPMQWIVLHGMGESAATISRAVERGWVILQEVRGKPLDRKAALTDEGRRLARKGR
jgi:hypothetical protein